MIHTYSIVLVIMVTVQLVTAETRRSSEKRLLYDLLEDYDMRTKPQGPSNESLQVLFDLSIVQIVDVDEKNQILTGIYFVVQQWIDEELRWDPAQYGGQQSLILPENEIWMPDIKLQNDVDLVLSKQSEVTSLLKVLFTGFILQTKVVSYKSSCSMDLKYFPFDKQSCTLTLSSYKYRLTEINLTSSLVFETAYYIENSGFKLTENELQVIQDVRAVGVGRVDISVLTYHLVFERRPLFHLFNLFLPCTMITLIAMLSFLIPPDSGEKLGLGITVLLSLTVFLLIISDQMPPTADLPLLSIYFFGIMLIVTICTCLSVLSLTMYYGAETKSRSVPYWIQNILFGRLAKLLCVNTSFTQKTDPENTHITLNKMDLNTQKQADGNGEFEEVKANPHNNVDIKLILQLFKRSESRVIAKERQDAIVAQWRQLTVIIDRILLVFFVTLNIIFTLRIIIQAA